MSFFRGELIRDCIILGLHKVSEYGGFAFQGVHITGVRKELKEWYWNGTYRVRVSGIGIGLTECEYVVLEWDLQSVSLWYWNGSEGPALPVLISQCPAGRHDRPSPLAKSADNT